MVNKKTKMFKINPFKIYRDIFQYSDCFNLRKIQMKNNQYYFLVINTPKLKQPEIMLSPKRTLFDLELVNL